MNLSSCSTCDRAIVMEISAPAAVTAAVKAAPLGAFGAWTEIHWNQERRKSFSNRNQFGIKPLLQTWMPIVADDMFLVVQSTNPRKWINNVHSE